MKNEERKKTRLLLCFSTSTIQKLIVRGYTNRNSGVGGIDPISFYLFTALFTDYSNCSKFNRLLYLCSLGQIKRICITRISDGVAYVSKESSWLVMWKVRGWSCRETALCSCPCKYPYRPHGQVFTSGDLSLGKMPHNPLRTWENGRLGRSCYKAISHPPFYLSSRLLWDNFLLPPRFW